MEDRRKIDKWITKGMVLIIGLLASFAIFAVKGWYDYTSGCAQSIESLENRVIILETIIPEIRDSLKDIKQELRRDRGPR